MIRTIDDFISSWDYETAMTLKVFGRLTDESLAQRVDPEGRTLGQLAWHVTCTAAMLREAGLNAEAIAYDDPAPATVQEIIDAYERSAKSVRETILRDWNDATLSEEVEMYGQTWTRGFALQAALNHEIHHRGQMTVLMRQAGLTVPGVYGPSREEWAEMGMEAMA